MWTLGSFDSGSDRGTTSCKRTFGDSCTEGPRKTVLRTEEEGMRGETQTLEDGRGHERGGGGLNRACEVARGVGVSSMPGACEGWAESDDNGQAAHLTD